MLDEFLYKEQTLALLYIAARDNDVVKVGDRGTLHFGEPEQDGYFAVHLLGRVEVLEGAGDVLDGVELLGLLVFSLDHLPKRTVAQNLNNLELLQNFLHSGAFGRRSFSETHQPALRFLGNGGVYFHLKKGRP